MDIDEIEKKLLQLVSNDKKSWVQIYKLMTEVEKNELFRPNYKSYTAWVNDFALRSQIHVSILWSRKKAGKYYDDYVLRQTLKGVVVDDINSLSLSPDNIVMVERIAGSDTNVADELISKVVSGKLKRSDLKNAWKTVQAERINAGKKPHRTNSHDKQFDKIDSIAVDSDVIDGESNRTDSENEKITATSIVLTLNTDKSWIGEPVYKEYFTEKYKLFTEFAVNTGTTHRARRIDTLVFETITTTDRNDVNIHGIEIKISKDDLLSDNKMAEYCEFCDFFWIAVPPPLVRFAKQIVIDTWGILEISKDKVSVVKRAEKHNAVFRDVTMKSALLKLL